MPSGFTKYPFGFYPFEARKWFLQQGFPVDSHACGVSIIPILTILRVFHESIIGSSPGSRRAKYLQVYPHFSGLSFLMDFGNAIDFCSYQVDFHWQIPARSISDMGVILFAMVVC